MVYLYRDKDGALENVTLKVNGNLNGPCLIKGVAVMTASVPFIALKVCMYMLLQAVYEANDVPPPAPASLSAVDQRGK